MSDGIYFVQIATCKDRVLEVEPDSGQQYGHWATIADMLLTGHGQRILPTAAAEGEHAIKVLLAFEDAESKQTTAIASVFLLCPCEIPVIAGDRARSAMVRKPAPQQKIATPSLIVP